jgi:hypothetical protein
LFWSCAGGGDLDLDGYDDVVFSDPFGGNSGRVYAYSGRNGTLLWQASGSLAADDYGFSLSFAGDVNGDGFADVVAGAPEGSYPYYGAGYFEVISGNPSPWGIVGGELAGSRGVPKLRGSGIPGAGLQVTISLTDVLENSVAYLVASLSTISLPLYDDAGHGAIFQYHEAFVKKALEFLES